MPRPLVENRRELIIEAARQLALEKGWQATTVSDIAARAGIGKGAVYLEFPDKPAVLDAVLVRSTRDLTAQVRDRVANSTELVDLAAVYRFGIEALLSDQLMTALYSGDEAVLGAHVRDVADGRYDERSRWLDDYTRRLQAAGVIDPDIAPGDIVRLLSVFTIGLVNAAGTIGPLSAAHLSSLIALFGDVLGRGLASHGPVDATGARDAQLALLDRLDEQLRRLDSHT